MLNMFNSVRDTFNSVASYVPGYSYLPSVFGSAQEPSQEILDDNAAVVINPQRQLPLPARLVNIRKLMALALDSDGDLSEFDLEEDEVELFRELSEILNIKTAKSSIRGIFDARNFLFEMCCKDRVTQEELQQFETFIMKEQEVKRFFNEKIKAFELLYRKLKAQQAFKEYGQDIAIEMADDGVKIDKQAYLGLLQQAFVAINAQLEDGQSQFEVSYSNETGAYTISKGDVNVEVTVDNGFSAQADALGPEANAALVVAAKQYVAARRQADPSKPVPPFTLTCSDQDEAKEILALLDHEGIPCTKVVLTETNQTLGQREIEALRNPQAEEELEEEQDLDLEEAGRRNRARRQF